jgi:hypothetical protein
MGSYHLVDVIGLYWKLYRRSCKLRYERGTENPTLLFCATNPAETRDKVQSLELCEMLYKRKAENLESNKGLEGGRF